MGFKTVRGNINPGLHSHDFGFHNQFGRHLSEPHENNVEQSHPGTGHEGLDPQANIRKRKVNKHQAEETGNDNKNGHKLHVKPPFLKLLFLNRHYYSMIEYYNLNASNVFPAADDHLITCNLADP